MRMAIPLSVRARFGLSSRISNMRRQYTSVYNPCKAPVLLGAVDLHPMGRIYYYDHRVYVVHLMFLSWGGYGIGATAGASGLGNQL